MRQLQASDHVCAAGRDPAESGSTCCKGSIANVKPFIKWAGGKRWLSALLTDLLDADERHVEPFVGSGAAFFATNPDSALLADCNKELISCYRVVKEYPQELINHLSLLTISRQTFLDIRQSKPQDAIARAARFVYLNRTAFNGLYRVNRMGEFNVPFGCKPSTKVCNADNILACSERLKVATLVSADYLETIASMSNEDNLYLDPPYTAKRHNGGFRRYNEFLFSWQDQCTLAREANRLSKLGCRIIISNANHPEIKALYDDDSFVAFSIKRASNLAASTRARGTCRELLLISRAIAQCNRKLRELIRKHFLGRARRLTLRQ